MNVVVLILSALCAVIANAEDPRLRVTRLDSLTRLGPGVALIDQGPVRISAARGEAEAFQLVLSADGGGFTDIGITASDLTSGGATISAAAVAIYREGFVQITNSSPRASEPIGWYPDPLIPLHNPYADAPETLVSLDAGVNQPIWVEVTVPRNAKPGRYQGHLTISANGISLATVPWTLKVWKFELPRTPALASSFGISTRDDLLAWYGVQRHTAAYYALTRRYVDFLLDHRLSPPWADDMQIDVGDDGSFKTVKKIGDLGSTADVFSHYFDEKGMSAVNAPFWSDWPFDDPLGADRQRSITYLRQFAAFAGKFGFADRLYVYPVDEPSSAKSYQQVRDWAAFFHEAGPQFRFLLTEQPRPQRPEWGSLAGSVDIWVPLTFTVQPEESWARVNAGDEMWSYTALAQNGYSPVWLMDRRPLEYRIFPWIIWNYGMTGLLYWETCYWEQVGDPWQHTASYDGYNGDGMLIYPADIAKFGFDGPIASLRLKWIRDSVDDYDYFVLLETLAGRKTVDKLIGPLATRWNAWSKDAGKLKKQRDKIGKRIEKLMGK